MRSLHKLAPSTLAWLLTLSGAHAGVLSFFNPSKADGFNGIKSEVQAFAADDPVSLHDLFNGWSGEYHPKKGKNVAIDDLRADVGVSYEKWGYFGYTYRHQYFVDASKDLTLLAWQQLNEKGFTQGKLYDLDISIKGFEADGIVYAKNFPLFQTNEKSLKLGVAVELLRGRTMQNGYLKGSAVANSSKDYDFSAISDYYYTENYLYDLDVQKANGHGYTTHLNLKYTTEKFTLQLLLNDIYGKIVWKRLPYSYVNINSSNKKYDENGYIVYNPVILGLEKYVDYTQKLHIKSRLQSSYKLNEKSEIVVGADHTGSLYLPYLYVSHRFYKDLQSRLFYESRFDMFGIEIAYRYFNVFISSNSFNNPSALKLILSLNYPVSF